MQKRLSLQLKVFKLIFIGYNIKQNQVINLWQFAIKCTKIISISMLMGKFAYVDI